MGGCDIFTVNFVVDLLSAVIDPRIKGGAR